MSAAKPAPSPAADLLGGDHPLLVVVGSGGVGKTTLAASLGIQSARRGRNTLVMTFDPSLRLKDALGVEQGSGEAGDEIPVPLPPAPEGSGGRNPGRLDASLLDARRTFDRLVERYAPDEAARRRILENRFYRHLAGNLSGILEYMAVERLFEVARSGRYDQVILDTPPTRQALDFLEAPERITAFLDSGAIRLTARDWFDADGRFRPTSRFGSLGRSLGRSLEGILDRVVGLEFLRDMLEFFQAFGPLYGGFRQRATEVQELLASERTRFLLVSGPGRERVPDTLFFARRLLEAGHDLGPVVINRVHPRWPELEAGHLGEDPCHPDGAALFAWLGRRDAEGVAEIRSLVGGSRPVVALPQRLDEPTDLAALEALGADLLARLGSDP